MSSILISSSSPTDLPDHQSTLLPSIHFKTKIPNISIKQTNKHRYDINEHTDVPPAGRDFGLKTAKVKAPEASGNRHKRKVILKDPGAWVGIPVNVVSDLS